MLSRRSAIAGLTAAVVGAACGGAPKPFRRSYPSLDDFAERYVRLTLRLARHQPSLVEAWLGPPSWEPDLRDPVAAIRKDIVDAHTALGDRGQLSPVDDRHRYLVGQFEALSIAARRLAGETMRFAAETGAALGLGPADLAPRASEIRRATEELDRRLPGRGTLHERLGTWRERHALSHRHVLPTLRAAIEACRARVMTHIRLPETESVEVDTGSDTGLEARAVYQGDYRTTVSLDETGPVDLAHVVWLAAHETYPGHHVQHLLAERDLVRAKHWHERELVPVFGRHHLCAEGAAEAGAALLLDGGTFEEICRSLAAASGVPIENIPDLVAVHRAVTMLDGLIPEIAQQYLDGDIGSQAAADRLDEEALVANGSSFLGAIERQRTRLLGYPVGRRLVSGHLADLPAEKRWPSLVEIATSLCVPQPADSPKLTARRGGRYPDRRLS